MQIGIIKNQNSFGALSCHSDFMKHYPGANELKKEFKDYENWDIFLSGVNRNVLINKRTGVKIASPFIAKAPHGNKMDITATWLDDDNIPFLAPKYQKTPYAHGVDITVRFPSSKKAVEAYQRLQDKNELETSFELARILEQNNNIV